MTQEEIRLSESVTRKKHWKRWGPYLSERAWGTVREDYSPYGNAWEYLPHDHAGSRAYRWNEDGLAGISDRRQMICFALALWNERDPILKERIFGLTGNEGNHGEDVKEYYFYLDSTPTHSYMKYLYKYPQPEFPYTQLVDVNRRRSRTEHEFELIETNVFDQDRYFDIFVEYAKNASDDMLGRVTVVNRAPETSSMYLLPTAWFRNTWSWGYGLPRPELARYDSHTIGMREPSLGEFKLWLEDAPQQLYTENESNNERLWNARSMRPYTNYELHRYPVE